MIANSTWRQDMTFEGHSESGHRIVFDADASHAQGPTPMEAVLMSLCACTSVDVIAILKKKREPFTGLTVSAIAEQAGDAPRVFTHIELVYRVTGDVSKKSMEDAVALSKNKYCSVSKMLEKAAKIEFRIEYAGPEQLADALVEAQAEPDPAAKTGAPQQ
jgi:putative redox protein